MLRGGEWEVNKNYVELVMVYNVTSARSFSTLFLLTNIFDIGDYGGILTAITVK